MALTGTKTPKSTIEWATPWPLFRLIETTFENKFTLDAAASDTNAKCEKYFTKETDGLKQSWRGETVWINPPYGAETGRWVEKAKKEVYENDCPTVVMLIVPRTDTRWWFDNIPFTKSVVFLKGRIPFENSENPANRPQDPSCLVIFKASDISSYQPKIEFWDWKAAMAIASESKA